jgi:hypothetical protein
MKDVTNLKYAAKLTYAKVYVEATACFPLIVAATFAKESIPSAETITSTLLAEQPDTTDLQS